MPRKLQYTDEQGEEICDWIANGNSLLSYTEREESPTFSTVYKWLDRVPAFAEAFARARERQAHADADRLNRISEQLQARQIGSDVARVMIDALKWTAGRRAPKHYGDKVQVSGDQDGAPLVVTWAGGDKL